MGMYLAVLSEAKAKVFVDQIFAKFDTDNSGEIDFKVSFTVSSYHWSPSVPDTILSCLSPFILNEKVSQLQIADKAL